MAVALTPLSMSANSDPKLALRITLWFLISFWKTMPLFTIEKAVDIVLMELMAIGKLATPLT